MARSSNNGRAQPVSTSDFNEQVRRLIERQPPAPPPNAKDKAKRLLRGPSQPKA